MGRCTVEFLSKVHVSVWGRKVFAKTHTAKRSDLQIFLQIAPLALRIGLTKRLVDDRTVSALPAQG